VFDLLSMHMRGRWTGFARGWEGVALHEIVHGVHNASEAVYAALVASEASGALDDTAEEQRRRVCCQLVMEDVRMCENGCVPWPAPSKQNEEWCASAAAASAEGVRAVTAGSVLGGDY
jgi:hypothetical protein